MNFILLAAGSGKRMGGNKALMPYQGKPWVLSQLQQIAEVGFQSITIVTNAEAEMELENLVADFSPKVLILTNLHVEQGPFSSLQLAIAATPEDASFVTPIDVPLKAVTLRKLRQTWLQHGHLDALIPSYNDRQGHPVIISTHLQREILKLNADNPQARLDFILRSVAENRKRIFPVEDPFIHINLNSPEDLASLS